MKLYIVYPVQVDKWIFFTMNFQNHLTRPTFHIATKPYDRPPSVPEICEYLVLVSNNFANTDWVIFFWLDASVSFLPCMRGQARLTVVLASKEPDLNRGLE